MKLQNIYLGGHNAHVPLSKDSDLSYEKYLKLANLQIVKESDNANAAIFIEMNTKDLRTLSPEIPIIFVRNEPIVVWPENYKKQSIAKVSKLIDVGRFQQDTQQFVPWPQDFTHFDESANLSSIRLNKTALISGNKLSFITGELYSLRRNCIINFADLDLYGTAWEISSFHKVLIFIAEIKKSIEYRFLPKLKNLEYWFNKPKNYLGSPDSKISTLRNYKYSLVIENSIDYMTEKLFDAFFAGTIPIYVGPKVELFGIPEQLVVQVGPTVEEIRDGIAKAKQFNHENWMAELHSWLSKPATKDLWSAEMVFPRIVNELINFLENHKN